MANITPVTKSGSTADNVLLGGHRFWHVSDHFPDDFLKRITEVDMGDWKVNPTKVHHSNQAWQTFAPADVHYHDVTITAHVDPSMDGKLQKELIAQATGAKKDYRFNFSVHLTDSSTPPVDYVKYDFIDCMLISVSNSPGDSHDTTNTLKEVIVIRPTRCDVPAAK
jgi:hypothetical protein